MKRTVELENYLPLNPNYKSILILDRKLTEEQIPHLLMRLDDG